jgi:hypothetical protein
MDEEEDLDRDVDSIIAQIKNQGKTIKNVEKERPELNKEDLEKFIIDNAASVVADSIEMIQSLKIDVMAGKDSRIVESTAELVKAVTGAIDALSKLKLSDDKIKAQKDIKKMDIDAKGDQLALGNQAGVFLSREEIIKNLFNRVEEPKTTEPPAIDV